VVCASDGVEGGAAQSIARARERHEADGAGLHFVVALSDPPHDRVARMRSGDHPRAVAARVRVLGRDAVRGRWIEALDAGAGVQIERGGRRAHRALERPERVAVARDGGAGEGARVREDYDAVVVQEFTR